MLIRTHMLIMHTHMLTANTHTRADTCTHVLTHAQYTHTHMCRCSHAHACSHTHMHTLSCMPARSHAEGRARQTLRRLQGRHDPGDGGSQPPPPRPRASRTHGRAGLSINPVQRALDSETRCHQPRRPLARRARRPRASLTPVPRDRRGPARALNLSVYETITGPCLAARPDPRL